MPISILICDDAKLARNQLARSLPENWDIQLLFAENGKRCIEIARKSNPHLIFMDLNMPEMDGYQTLQMMKQLKMNFKVVVVSGDIQPDARARVLQIGAIDFVKKPIAKDDLHELLVKHGFSANLQGQALSSTTGIDQVDLDNEATFIEVCQEIANVAMGRAAGKLAEFLNVFVELPIPKVNYIEISELAMALDFAQKNDQVSAVCQGFLGPDLSGEALVIFNHSSFENIAELMKHQDVIDENTELELLMDMANILVGSCLQSISEQLDVMLYQSTPFVLRQKSFSSALLAGKQWQKTLSIEITYTIENKDISCDLLFLFTEDCIDNLKHRLSFLVES